MVPCFDLDLGYSKLFFSCMALWHMILHHHTKFDNKMFCSSENITQTFSDILNLCCDLDLECSNPIFPQNTLAYDDVLPNQVWLQTTSSLDDKSRDSHILIRSSLTMILTLKTANQVFCMMPMMLHYHTKFGIKMNYVSEDIIQTNIH